MRNNSSPSMMQMDVIVWICNICTSLCYSPFNGSPPFPPVSPIFLSSPSVIALIVCMGGVPVPYAQHCTYPPVSCSHPYCLPVHMILSCSLSTYQLSSIICQCNSGLLLPPPHIPQFAPLSPLVQNIAY